MHESVLTSIQTTMTERAGVLRSESGLALGELELAVLTEKTSDSPNTDAWQTTNLLTLGTKLLEAARMREETRGSHWREDFPETDDLHWLGHIDITSDAITYRPGVVT